MNSPRTEAPDYPARTSGHSQLDLNRCHAKAFWNEGNCVEQTVRNYEPCPRVARSSLLFLSVKVNDVHFGLPTGIDTPAKGDCEQLQPLRSSVFNEDQRSSHERSTFFIDAMLLIVVGTSDAWIARVIPLGQVKHRAARALAGTRKIGFAVAGRCKHKML
jgi:hypothetical protein